MADHITTPPFPARLVEPFRRALAGDTAEWPGPLTSAEVESLQAHGVDQLVFAWSRDPLLREAAVAAAATEAMRHGVLGDAIGALRDAGVVPLILKGGALAYELYAAPELRPRSDTDLLIDEADRARTAEALKALGYQEQVTSGDEHGLRQRAYVLVDRFALEHALDVHWSIANPAAFARVLEYRECLEESVAVPQLHEHARGLGRAHALLLACVHRVAHHHDTDRLIWLVDIELLARQMTPEMWSDFWQLAKARGVARVAAASLAAAAKVSGVEHATVPTLPSNEPSAMYLDRGVTRGSLLLNELRALPGWGARIARLRDLAFPRREYLEHEFGVRGGVALTAAYLRRSVRGVLRLFRRVA